MPKYHDWVDPSADPPEMDPGAQPIPDPPGSSVRVNWIVEEEDLWTAGWQGDGKALDFTGTRAEVMEWAARYPADRRWIFSVTANDWVPLDLPHGSAGGPKA